MAVVRGLCQRGLIGTRRHLQSGGQVVHGLWSGTSWAYSVITLSNYVNWEFGVVSVESLSSSDGHVQGTLKSSPGLRKKVTLISCWIDYQAPCFESGLCESSHQLRWSVPGERASTTHVNGIPASDFLSAWVSFKSEEIVRCDTPLDLCNRTDHCALCIETTVFQELICRRSQLPLILWSEINYSDSAANQHRWSFWSLNKVMSGVVYEWDRIFCVLSSISGVGKIKVGLQ